MNLSKIAQQLGKKGGKKSVESRFGGKTKSEISEIMRKVRLTKSEKAEFSEMVDESIENLKRNIELDS